MKLKTLVGSMMVLGVVSTGVIAAPSTPEAGNKAKDAVAVPEDTTKAVTDVAEQAFWTSIIDRNQDNAYLVPNLSSGQVKLSGLITVNNTANKFDLAKSDLSENDEELYVDARANDFTTFHLALAYGLDNTIKYLNGSDTTDAGNAKKKLYIPEAYAKMTYGNFFAKVGQQYINFGSTSHQSISTPLTQILSQTDQLAITLGMKNVHGLYGGASLYKGADYGSHIKTDSKSDATEGKKNKFKGYAIDLGYALHNNSYSANVYAGYISNMLDVNALDFRFSDAIGDKSVQATQKAVPAVAVHGDMTVGPVQLSANFVSAIKKFDAADYALYGTSKKDEELKPLAYGLEANYTFMPKQTITLGFQGTKNAGGLNPYDFARHQMPKQRLLAAYTYQLSDHVSLAAEYDRDTQYSSGASFQLGKKERAVGSGKIDNTILAKLKVAF